MKTRMTLRTMVVVLTVAGFAAVTVPAWAAGPSAKDKANYNRSMAALLGGIASIKSADANTLKTIGDHLQKMVQIRLEVEKLRAQRMENRAKAAQNYYEKRKLYEAAKKQRPVRRLTPEQRQNVAKRRVPVRLSSFQSAAPTGQVSWPTLLTGGCFAQCRARIDKLMAERTPDNSGAGTENCEQIQAAVAQMKALLQQQVRELSPMDYLAAKKFLEGLAYEARFPVAAPTLNAVAAND